MAFDRVKLLFLLFCATVLVGVSAYAKAFEGQGVSLRIGMFNSQKKAQVFFEAFPVDIKKHIRRNQLWVNAYQTPSGLMEHNLEISDLTDKGSKALCAYVRQQEMQCFISTKAQLPPSSFVLEQGTEKKMIQNHASVPSLPKMLQPLGMRLSRSSIQDLDLTLTDELVGPFEHQKNIDAYGETFSLEPQYLDTPEAQAAKAAYEVARNRFVDTLRNVGDGVNAGQGNEVAQQQLIALGQDVFEAAGSVYLSGFLERELGQAEVLSSDAGSGETFIHHVKKNISESAKNTVESLISDLLSGIGSEGGSDNFYADKTDAFMLSGARGLIDAGLAAAKRSDLYALRHIELEYNINNFEDSYFSALITQPVYQSADVRHNIFLQGGGILNEKSVDIDDDVARHTLNMGAAYRYLTVDEKYLIGGNVFFDHQWPYNHSRMSVGLDAKTKELNLAANYYYPLTDFQDSRRDTNNLEYEERALEGYDLELGYTPPFLTGMSVYSKGYQYFRKTDDDIRGVELSAEYNIRDNFTIKGSVVEENGGRDGVELAVQYRMPLYDEDKPNLALAAIKPAAGRDSVRSEIFEKVRRENRIRVEERLKVNSSETIITAQFSALSVGLPFDVGGVLTGAGVNLPFNTAITVPNGDFGIITFSNGAIANVSASGGGDVILEFNNTTLTVTATNGGFVQFISGSGGGITVVNVPGGTVNLLGTDIDVTDDGVTTTIQVRAGQIEVVPSIGVDLETGNQADIVSLTIGTGATTLLVDPALTTRREAAYTNLDLVNPDPPTTDTAAPFISVTPDLITGPQFVGNNADLRLTFTQAITVSGAPFINGFIDANARTFAYNAGASTSTQLVFRHVYIAGDVGSAAITISDLDLNGGTIIGTANSLDALTVFTNTVVAISDQTVPMLTGSTPVDNEPAFSAADNIVLNFDENVQANIGNITLTDTTDGSSTTVIPIGDAQVSIVGSTVTINPTGILDLTTDYDLVIGAGVIEDTAGNAFAGIATTELNFTTSNDVTPPTFAPATDASPADNDVDVLPTDNIVITFSEAVNKNVGNIEIRRTADDALLETIDVTTGLVTGGGTNTVTINPASDYPLATDVYVLIDAGAFEDLVGNPYAGIASTTAFNFRGFQPVDVAGLNLWLDGNDLDGDSAPEGAAESGITAGAIATWVDKSGAGNNVTQGTAGKRPNFVTGVINGIPVARFDGSNDVLTSASVSIPSTTGHTMFIVIDVNNSGSSSTIFRHRPNGGYGTRSGVSLEMSSSETYVNTIYEDTIGNAMNNDGTAAPAAPSIISHEGQSSGLVIRHDGVIADSTHTVQAGATPLNNVDGNTPIGIGNNVDSDDRPLLGDVAEVLFFDDALSVADRQAIERYLGTKYNIVVP